MLFFLSLAKSDVLYEVEKWVLKGERHTQREKDNTRNVLHVGLGIDRRTRVYCFRIIPQRKNWDRSKLQGI